MHLPTLLTACLTLSHAHLAHATKLAMTRCYCVSDTEVGYVSVYNLTTPSPSSYGKYTNSSSTVWYRNGTVHTGICGTECNAARSACWEVPVISQYPSITAHAWPSDHRTACVSVPVSNTTQRICASADFLQIDGSVQDLRAGHASAVYSNKVDCSAECGAQWPERGMKSACSHVNDNRKSKHYNEAVPCGYYWSGNRFLTLGEEKVGACAVDVRYW